MDDANRGVRPARSDSAAGRPVVQAVDAGATMTMPEGFMPIRVLATFPAIPSDLAFPADQPTTSGSAAGAEGPESGVAVSADATGPRLRLAVSPAVRAPRPIRSRAAFPNASIAALAVVAAAIWTLIAIREARPPAATERDVRIAVEPNDTGTAEAMLR